MSDETPKTSKKAVNRRNESSKKDVSTNSSGMMSVNSSGQISDDSDWEDLDVDQVSSGSGSGDEDASQDKLTIDEAKPGCSKDGGKDEDCVPENILRECRKLISSDKRLDKKARMNNMTSKQVKLVLKHIFSSEQIIAMLRDKGLLTSTSKQDEDIEAAGPKMTRSVARTMTESGDICPWIINPKTPAKETPQEIISLVTGDFPEDEDEDPEYYPELEASRGSDDEDSFLDTSEAGTPNTQHSRSTVNTPDLESPALGFRAPGLPLSASSRNNTTPRTPVGHSPRSRIVSRNLTFEENSQSPQVWEGYDTRSRRPMTELNIEQLEQQFIPFDITPDMYDIPVENDEYSEFLQALYSGKDKTSVVDSTLGDEDMDPEYSFPPDEEDIRLKDPEELRHDKATKISRKELADLMAELLDCGNEANRKSEQQTIRKKGTKLKKKRIGASAALPPTPATPDSYLGTPEAAQQLEEGVDSPALVDTSTQSQKDTSQVKLDASKESVEPEEVKCMTDDQISQLAAQVQQHIQQICQMRLITANTKSFQNISYQCDEMLSNIKEKASQNFNSVMNQINLDSSLEAIEIWNKIGESSTQQKIKNKRESRKKRIMKFNPTKQFADFMSNQRIFPYPELMTLSSLITSPGKVIWTSAEDMLLAQGLEWINYQNNSSKCNQNRKRFLSKISLSDLAKTLRIKRIPAKTAEQIYFRLKNLRRESLADEATNNKEDMNPVVQFFSYGELPSIELLGNQYPRNYPPQTMRDLVQSGNRELPDVYVETILNKSTNTKPTIKRVRNIEPKELIEVEPDIPSDSDFSSDSDDGSQPAAKRPLTQGQVGTLNQPLPKDTKVKLLKMILPTASPVRTKSRYQPLLPAKQPIPIHQLSSDAILNYKMSSSTTDNRFGGILNSRISSSITCTSLNQLPGLRPAFPLCVDGNDTPVSMSESDTPTSTNRSQPFFPPVTSTNADSTTSHDNQSTTPPSTTDNIKMPAMISKPVFKSPEKTGSSLVSSYSPRKSPFKSPLKSLTNTYHRSPLKAASDRIIRKYTSPLKRKRPGRSSAGPITPKRLMLMGGDEKVQSPRTPKSQEGDLGCQISPRGVGGDSELDTPTGLARRKSRVQREAEITALLLSENLETQEEKEAREQRESQELFSSINTILQDNPDLTTRYEDIIGTAGDLGVRQTYTQLHDLMQDFPDVQELLLDLLTEEDALCLGMATYSAYSDRNRLKRFLCKLAIVYKQQPAYHVKVLKELETLSKDSSLTSERLKDISCQLFRNNQHLMEEFQMLIPGIPPPQSMLPSPEVITLPEEGNEEGTGGDEHIHVPRSPDRNMEGNMGSIRFSGGRCYVMEGKMLKPATINKVMME